MREKQEEDAGKGKGMIWERSKEGNEETLAEERRRVRKGWQRRERISVTRGWVGE